jgi:hypothetical protein
LSKSQKDPIAVTSGRLGAHIMHSRNDGRAVTAVARAKAQERFLVQARAEAAARGETVTEAELQRRAHHLKKAFYAAMAMKSVLVRAKKKNADPAMKRVGEEVSRASGYTSRSA